MFNLSRNAKISNALDHAEGTADRNGAIVDMAGFDSLMIVVKFGDIAAGAATSIKAQQGAAAAMGDAADLAGSKQTVADDDDNKIFYIDIHRPEERYLRLVVDKDASNNTEEMAWYVQYNAKDKPVTHGATVAGEFHLSPAEGTA